MDMQIDMVGAGLVAVTYLIIDILLVSSLALQLVSLYVGRVWFDKLYIEY